MKSTIRWAPDGKSVLVFGPKVDQSFQPTNTIGMLRFTTKHPFSPDPKDWKAPKRFQTDVSQTRQGRPRRDALAGRQADGCRLELQPAGAVPALARQPTDWLLQNDRKLSVNACRVIWRPDGKELLVVQSDCNRSSTGDLVRIPLVRPQQQQQLRLNGDNPSYQPLTIR